jgi:hypothetical protein
LSGERSFLWDWMPSSLLGANWFVNGDFNMVEWEGDQGGGTIIVVTSVEK